MIGDLTKYFKRLQTKNFRPKTLTIEEIVVSVHSGVNRASYSLNSILASLTCYGPKFYLESR